MNLRTAGCAWVALFLFLDGTALAGPRDDILEAMGTCAAVADDKARLACYDTLSPRLKDALATPPATLQHPPTKQEQESWFGFDIGSLFGLGSSAKQTTPQQFGSETTPQGQAAQAVVETEEINSITAVVTDYSFGPFGKFIVFLDNGQIWRQAEGETDQARFLRNPQDNKIAISRGAFGSYSMQINSSNKVFKVVRVK
jgi:hypothetical protein